MTNTEPHLYSALVNLDLGAVLDLRDQHAPPLLHLGHKQHSSSSDVTWHLSLTC